ncbi:MAG TPA: hypothetical protein VFR11_01455 [Micromonosporaceae bacterium]|nr:hypothetical protein [Micromonosporaceae bacterium]
MDRTGTTQTGSAVYVMGLIGALVFYPSGRTATTPGHRGESTRYGVPATVHTPGHW